MIYMSKDAAGRDVMVLDFSNSGQGKPAYLSVRQNGLEFMRWDSAAASGAAVPAGSGAAIQACKVTTAQRNAIPTTAGDAGIYVYNTTTNKLNVWTGAAWEAVTSA